MPFGRLRVSPGISPVENRFRRAQPVPRLTTELRALHEAARLSELGQRCFGPEAYWNIFDRIRGGSAALASETVAERAEGRPLHLVSFCEGEVAVLAWCQMHRDESTATMTPADISSFLARHPIHALVRALSRRLGLRFIPMVNPRRCAARFRRHNAAGIDVKRRCSITHPGCTILDGHTSRILHGRQQAAWRPIALSAPAHNDDGELSERRCACAGWCARRRPAGGRARHPLRRRL